MYFIGVRHACRKMPRQLQPQSGHTQEHVDTNKQSCIDSRHGIPEQRRQTIRGPKQQVPGVHTHIPPHPPRPTDLPFFAVPRTTATAHIHIYRHGFFFGFFFCTSFGSVFVCVALLPYRSRSRFRSRFHFCSGFCSRSRSRCIAHRPHRSHRAQRTLRHADNSSIHRRIRTRFHSSSIVLSVTAVLVLPRSVGHCTLASSDRVYACDWVFNKFFSSP